MPSMPAIRIYYRSVLLRLDHLPSHYCVQVKTRSGDAGPLRWLGFVYQPLLDLTSGLGYGKILVREVTNDAGLPGAIWKAALPGEYLLGWRCEFELTTNTCQEGIFGVVDAKGWPVLVGGRPALRMVG